MRCCSLRSLVVLLCALLQSPIVAASVLCRMVVSVRYVLLVPLGTRLRSEMLSLSLGEGGDISYKCR